MLLYSSSSCFFILSFCSCYVWHRREDIDDEVQYVFLTCPTVNVKMQLCVKLLFISVT